MNLRYEAHNREASGEDGRARLGCRPITLRSFAGGDVQCSIDHDDEEAILESADTRLEVNLRGGYTLLNTGGEFGQELAGNVQLGPPFGGTRVKPPLFTAEALTAGGVKRLSITSPPNPTDGLSITRTFSLAAGGVVRIDHRLTNRSGAATRAKLRMRAETKYRGHVAAPLSEGTVREPMFSQHEYPASDTDLLASGARLAENWIAAEQDGRVAGLVWEGDAEQERNWSLLPMLTFDSGEAPPYGAVDLPAVWWITGRGDWRMVREWWKRLCAPSDLEERSDPEPVRILEAEVEPSPILLRADAATVRLALVSRRGMAIKGSLTAASDRFRVETAALTFADVSRAAPFRTDMRLETADQRFAGTIAATVDTGVLRDELKLPAVHLGTGDTVQRSEPGPGRICIDNGYMTLRFANGFFGALQSLEVQGVEQLRSAWPEAVPMVWMNPWFGGVHPYTEWMGSPRLARETVTCEPVEREGERGWLWHGARLTCEPRHRDRRWLRAEVEYLTLPGSNVVALCVRCTNLTDARMVEKLGVAVWAQPGGAHSGSVIHWERDGEHRVRRRGGFNADGTSTCWAAIANPDTTDALVLVSSESSHAVEWEDLETEGAHLQAGGRIVLQPRESREWLVWLVHTREVSQAASYGAALSRARRLP